MTKLMRATSHTAADLSKAPWTEQVRAGLRSLWISAKDRLVAAERAEMLAELTVRQLGDCGLGDALNDQRHRVAVDGNLMRRLMSLG